MQWLDALPYCQEHDLHADDDADKHGKFTIGDFDDFDLLLREDSMDAVHSG